MTHIKSLQAQTDKALAGMLRKAFPHQELESIARALEENAVAQAAQDHTRSKPVYPHERLDPLDHAAFLDHLEEHQHLLHSYARQSHQNALDAAIAIHRPDPIHAQKGDRVVRPARTGEGYERGYDIAPVHGVVLGNLRPGNSGGLLVEAGDTIRRHKTSGEEELTRPAGVHFFPHKDVVHIAQHHLNQQSQKSLRMRSKSLPHEELHAIARDVDEVGEPADHAAFLDKLDEMDHPMRGEAAKSPRHAVHVARTLTRPKDFRKGDVAKYETRGGYDTGEVEIVDHNETDDTPDYDWPVEARMTHHERPHYIGQTAYLHPDEMTHTIGRHEPEHPDYEAPQGG